MKRLGIGMFSVHQARAVDCYPIPSDPHGANKTATGPSDLGRMTSRVRGVPRDHLSIWLKDREAGSPAGRRAEADLARASCRSLNW